MGLTTSSTHLTLFPRVVAELDPKPDPDPDPDPEAAAPDDDDHPDCEPEEDEDEPLPDDQEELELDELPFLLMIIVPLLMTVLLPFPVGICLEQSSASTVLTDVDFLVITTFFLACFALAVMAGTVSLMALYLGRIALGMAFSLVTFPIISVPPTPLSWRTAGLVEIHKAAAVEASFSGSTSGVGAGLFSLSACGRGSGLDSGSGSTGTSLGEGTGTRGGRGSDFGSAGLSSTGLVMMGGRGVRGRGMGVCSSSMVSGVGTLWSSSGLVMIIFVSTIGLTPVSSTTLLGASGARMGSTQTDLTLVDFWVLIMVTSASLVSTSPFFFFTKVTSALSTPPSAF